MDAAEDMVGSAKPPKPPKPPKPHDSDRRMRFLMCVITVAAVAAAAFGGITAWETHQDRANSKAFYCTFASDPGTDPGQKQLSDQLDC